MPPARRTKCQERWVQHVDEGLSIVDPRLGDEMQTRTTTQLTASVLIGVLLSSCVPAQRIHETVVEDECGSLTEIYQYTNSCNKRIAHGVYVMFYSDGSIARFSEYADGVRQGVEYDFYEGGRGRLRLVEYDEGKPHGEWKIWSAEGELSLAGHFHEGLPVGEWEEYWPNGRVKGRGTFRALDDSALLALWEREQVPVKITIDNILVRSSDWQYWDEEGHRTREHE